MLEARNLNANGRLVVSRTQFLPPVVSHLVPRDKVPVVARGMSIEAAAIGNLDVRLRGRQMQDHYLLETTVDMTGNSYVCGHAAMSKMANQLGSLFMPASAEPLHPHVHSTPDLDPYGALPTASAPGDVCRAIGAFVGLLFDHAISALKAPFVLCWRLLSGRRAAP